MVVVIVTVVVVVVNVVVVIVVVVVCEAGGSFVAIRETMDLVRCTWTNYCDPTETDSGDLEISSSKSPYRREVLRLCQLARWL